MRKLIFKLIVFSVVTLVVSRLVVSIIPVTPHKNFSPCQINHVENHINDYNVFFVGSSRFGRQIDPVLFDSLNKHIGTHSYNYSFDAAFAPTSLNLANELISLEPKNLKFLILEITPLEFTGGIDPGHIQRSICWYRPDDFTFLFLSDVHLTLTLSEALITFKDWSYLVAYRLFSVGDFWNRIPHWKNDCETDNRYPEPVPVMELSEELRQELQEMRVANSTKSLQGFSADLENSSYFKRLKLLERTCASKNIELVYVVAPRMNLADIKYIESMAKELDQQRVLRLNIFDVEEAIYSDSLTADAKHVNKKGIELFTSTLSKGIGERMKQLTNNTPLSKNDSVP